MELVFAKHAMVHKDTGELVANRLVEQYGYHRRVHAARQTEYHTVGANLRFEFAHCALHKCVRTPFLLAAAYVHHEISQQECPLQRMEHLGVELCAEDRCVGIALRRGKIVSSVFDGLGRSHHLCTLRNTGNTVAMRHPYLRVVIETTKKRTLLIYI